jgi:K+-transporting ATPase ATPase C chain
MKIVRPSLVITTCLLLLCCVAYPALVTGLAQAVFPHQANGSLITQNGHVRGSSLIGQTLANPETHPEYFWGRRSAASVDSATGVVYSSGSNYGPLHPALREEVAARVALLRASGVVGPIPVDLVTTSGSGLDPHISPAAAEAQAARVARARGMTLEHVRALITAHTEPPTLGLLGAARVNVLELNLDLDAHSPR